MKVNLDTVANEPQFFAARGIAIPQHAANLRQIQHRTHRHPRWVHFGPGNIFRIFLARIADDALAAGEFWPITAVKSFSRPQLDCQLQNFDLLTTGVFAHANGQKDMRIIGGIGQALVAADQYEALKNIFVDADMSMVTFTITEKGYKLPADLTEVFQGDAVPIAFHSHTIFLVAGLLLARFQGGAAPINLLSCDNFSNNGDNLRAVLLQVADFWHGRGLVSQAFVDWLGQRDKVAFPNSVIDKITPRPADVIADYLQNLGLEDMGISQVKGATVAGFVNAEPTEYLVIEDAFAAPHPTFEKYGAHLASGETVKKFEQMKVTGCLNPIHTALAVSGAVLGYKTIDQALGDPVLRKLVDVLGYEEILPVVPDPKIVRPADFLAEAIEQRFSNSSLPDSPLRIAMDTSQKLPIRFGITLQQYLRRGRSLEDLVAIPLVFATWCRYLLGISDSGVAFAPSADPLREDLQSLFEGVYLGGDFDAHAILAPLLEDSSIFGVDLYHVGLGRKVEDLFVMMTQSEHAVKQTIKAQLEVFSQSRTSPSC
ncbi:MAG: mannitol dehydrogenase family protein [Actinomycetaceae bacterium]|nr:mannitol dehydrogenase family protein [Actinomycetaceae bacterium]